MAGKRGCFFTSLIVLFVLIVIAVILAFTAYRLAVGTTLSYPVPNYDASDTSTIANVVTRLARSLVDKEGRVVNTAVLKLSQNEVQTLIDAAIVRSIRVETLSLPYSAAWEDGRLKVHFSMPLSSHGKAANLDLELSPFVENGKLTLVPGRGAVGDLPLPGFALRKAARELERMAMRDDSIRTALSAFTRIEPGDDGTLLLMFDPRNVNTVVRILKGEPIEELDKGEVPENEDDDSEDDDDSGDDRDEYDDWDEYDEDEYDE